MPDLLDLLELDDLVVDNTIPDGATCECCGERDATLHVPGVVRGNLDAVIRACARCADLLITDAEPDAEPGDDTN